MAAIGIEATQCKCGHGRERHADVIEPRVRDNCLLADCYCENFRMTPEDCYVEFTR